ncbi:hypothetical protein AA0115_g12932 [Alternaria tenuissima]|uniref:F-box domain-containing protein n=1 Tax=Alternaria tenuissima TaxID=119927 RepID=A0AB37W1Y3_9PLEO|nr:hypothetical protein AA0115_g12932 [Alternaria tenuissima]
MAPPLVPWPQKRKASTSDGSISNKRTRSVSISVKVTHSPVLEGVLGSPEVPVVPKNPQACLDGIPEELLLHVAEYLDTRLDALAELCLTNHRCKRVAEEVLYRNIGMQSDDWAKAQSVASNTRLASHVRHFSSVFDWNDKTLVTKDWNDKVLATRDEFDKILANAHKIQTFALNEIAPHHSRNWTNRHDFLVGEMSWLDLINLAVAQSIDGQTNQFTHLNKLTIVTDVLSLEEISCVFRLPSLNSLFLQDVHQTTPFRDWPIPTSSSPIREIALRNAMMDISAVAQMISSVKSLSNFMYEHNTMAWEPFGNDDNPMSVWPEHSWKLLGDALRKHRDTLVELYAFSYSDKALLDIIYPDGRDLGTLGSFQDFSKLQYCGIPIEAVLDAATAEDDLSVYFPAHLKRWYTHITPGTPKLLERCAPVLASLRDIVCLGQDKTVRVVLLDGLPFQALELSRALAELEEAGIKLEIRYDYDMITLDELKRLEAPSEEEQSDEESDEELIDQPEVENDEVEGYEIPDATEQEIADVLDGNSQASFTTQDAVAGDPVEDVVDYVIPAASHCHEQYLDHVARSD